MSKVIGRGVCSRTTANNVSISLNVRAEPDPHHTPFGYVLVNLRKYVQLNVIIDKV